MAKKTGRPMTELVLSDGEREELLRLTKRGRVNRGLAIDGQYHPINHLASGDRLFCLSLPYLLGQHPFAQGITSSAEMAETVAQAIQHAQA